MLNVLFVCTGNICRSPTAEGVFIKLAEEAGLSARVRADSAGTHSCVGEPPDMRSQIAAKQRGIDLSQLRARQVRADDFDKFDYILAMSSDHYAYLAKMCPDDKKGKLHLFMNFAPNSQYRDIPDPYYGHHGGFELVLDLITAASVGLLADIRQRLDVTR